MKRKEESGRYGSADEPIVKALESLEEVEWFRAAIAEGDKGEGIPYTPELRAEMRGIARRRSGRD